MEPRIPRRKSVYILPNLFTTASLFAGFLGLLWASQGRYEECALAILFSALMDGLDGKVARLTHTASEFGIQYDSLADLIAFGLTPAFLVFHMALSVYGKLGLAVCFLFVVCSALRLARFNVTTGSINKRFFIGLPTPAAGCTLACHVLFLPFLPEALVGYFGGMSLFLTALLGLLMVSSVRYASFKELGFFKAHPFSTMVSIIFLFALIVANPKVFGFLILMGYLLSGLLYTFLLLPRLTRIMGKNAAQNQVRQRDA